MREELLGIAEIADLTGQRRQTVAQWHKRGWLPPPSYRLAMGPIWRRADLEGWLRLYRSGLPPWVRGLAANAAKRQQEGLVPSEWRAEVSASHSKAQVARAERLIQQHGLWPWPES